jgi:hypothetical protein
MIFDLPSDNVTLMYTYLSLDSLSDQHPCEYFMESDFIVGFTKSRHTSHINPANTLLFCLLDIYFNIIFLCLPSGLFPSEFQTHILLMFLLSHACSVPALLGPVLNNRSVYMTLVFR